MSYSVHKNGSVPVTQPAYATQDVVMDGPPVLLGDHRPGSDDDNTSYLSPASTLSPQDAESRHVILYILVPLAALLFISVLSFVVVFILKKSRLDKLRHHLMPLYNFEPGEEEGDWESELLEEEKEQHIGTHIRYHALRSPSPTDGPKLKFTTESLEV